MKEYAEQNCNFYKEELLKLQNLDTTNYSESDVNIIVNKMKFYGITVKIQIFVLIYKKVILNNKIFIQNLKLIKNHHSV